MLICSFIVLVWPHIRCITTFYRRNFLMGAIWFSCSSFGFDFSPCPGVSCRMQAAARNPSRNALVYIKAKALRLQLSGL
ncbi:uncharacterized protein PHACADRAFT_262768 [Phanerochaete carnosa HHB-10118-sp]|uniref:Secreted protein n=1 Tax=Phanerochaete carnosa (strain HHB-10118-sp) TaxID=650164 RepID=K5VWC8_PHACS|nr:uncharacterized protein PHACADRAFT_262768 [Phanerochaete carnosa HHB-10118-sp]EKM50889.1 hypothetical protein PHACADRAFT_262768 [Phanerochaete carnosa HHB-10118-sp]